MTTLQQVEDFVQKHSPAVVVAITPSAVCNQAVKYLKTFVPESVAIAVVDINENNQFQSHFMITVAPTVYVYKDSELEAEFVLPFNQEQILCALK